MLKLRKTSQFYAQKLAQLDLQCMCTAFCKKIELPRQFVEALSFHQMLHQDLHLLLNT